MIFTLLGVAQCRPSSPAAWVRDSRFKKAKQFRFARRGLKPTYPCKLLALRRARALVRAMTKHPVRGKLSLRARDPSSPF